MTGTTTTINLPGYCIGALATASRSSFVDAALGLAAVVGAIAGPASGLEAVAGDLVHPGLNVVVAGGESPSWHRLEELLLEPVTACQVMFRNMSRDTTPDRLDHLQFSHVHDHTHDVVAKSKRLFTDPGSKSDYVSDSREIEVLRRPTFYLRGPDYPTLCEALPEIMDGSALLTYGGELFANLLDKRCTKDWTQLGASLAGGMSGQDRPFERDKRYGPGRIETVRTHLLVTTTREQLGNALAAENAAVQRILQHCLLLEPYGAKPEARMELQTVRYGYQIYYNTINEVLDARRAGTGFRLGLKPPVSAALHEFTGEVHDLINGVSARLQPFFASSLSLPYRLHFAFTATLHPREDDVWVLPFTMATTREVLHRQKRLLEELVNGAEADAHAHARIAMLWKLADKPLVLRDLLRRYGVQRRDVHEPMLRELLAEGLVCARGDGLLELAPQGRTYLAAA